MEQEKLKMEAVQLKLDDKEVEDDYSDIRLRLVHLSDVDHFMEWLTDEKVSEFCSWECYTSKDAAINFLANNAIPHPWFRVICLRDKPIGSIAVTPYKGTDCWKAELGYALASKYWGKGIVTKAVKMVASTIFVEWPHLQRLEALVVAENQGSQRVLEKAGFSKEGVLRKYYLLKGKLRDMAMFSLLSTDHPLVNNSVD